ncbi:autotransporter outer membrane beta-barrel domain-containing protein [Portibacter lacus]|uniref:IPTL-CTERM protein sorting domain-containing protein n=1 Tax=Portibacter lacus TaxID=1099794 RepID=A0AA37WCE4_9BACT|nr:hypothetical protein [Portibacter lacus]GLR16003.1 hypothetical protein GCM10007940_06180 [Portibacter lacus]
MPKTKSHATSGGCHIRGKISAYLSIAFLIITAFTNLLSAQTTYTSVANGNWASAATWDGNGVPPTPIPPGDVVIVNNVLSSTSLITNQGVINITQAGNGGLDLYSGAILTNSGTINVNSNTFGSALGISTGATLENDGLITVDGGTQFSTLRITGGTLNNNSGATLDLSYALGTIQNAGGLFNNLNGGQVNIGPSSQFNVLFFSQMIPFFNNSGIVELEGFMFLGNELLMNSVGSFENLPGGIINIRNETNTTMQLDDATLNNQGTIYQDGGVLRLGQNGSLINSNGGNYVQVDGNLTGLGNIDSPTLMTSSQFSPGSSVEDYNLTLNGNYQGMGMMQIYINNANKDIPKLSATGTADVTADTLEIAGFGFTPSLGITAELFTAAGGITGPFSSVEYHPFFPSPGAGLQYEIIYEPTRAYLLVVAPPTAICQSVTASVDSSCEAIVSADQFDGGSTDPEMDMLSFSASPAGPYAVGTTNITLTVSDGVGSDQCNTSVTVNDDILPIVTCTSPIIFLDENNMATITAADLTSSITDECGILGTTLSQSSFDDNDLGPQMITVTATDNNGNMGTCVASATVTSMPAGIPTLSQWGLIILSISILILGVLFLQQKFYFHEISS